MKLTPEDLQKLHTKQVANIIRKLNAGKPLTAREEAILAQAAPGGESDSAQSPASGYAKTWDELADACSVDRRTLTNVRQREAQNPALPKDRADGRKEIAAWIRFLEELGVRGRGVNNPDADFLDERTLRLKERKLLLERAEFELEKAKARMLPVADFEAALGTMLGHFRATVNAMPARAAGKIVTRARAALLFLLKDKLPPKSFAKVEQLIAKAPIDYADIEEVLSAETDIILRTLETCDYLTPEVSTS